MSASALAARAWVFRWASLSSAFFLPFGLSLPDAEPHIERPTPKRLGPRPVGRAVAAVDARDSLLDNIRLLGDLYVITEAVLMIFL